MRIAVSYTYLKPIPLNIPQPLRDSKRWTVWKPIKRGDLKPGKMPMYNRLNPLTGTYEAVAASLDNLKTWMTLDEAVKMLKGAAVFKGLQYVLSYHNDLDTTKNRLVGVDLDDVMLKDGVTIKPEIKAIIDSFASYTELSPSGKGVRIFCYGYFPLKELVHQGSFEIYQCDKLLTVTGNHLINTPLTLSLIHI